MKKPSHKNTDADVAARLVALLEEVPLDAGEVDETLRDAGIDAKSATARMMARVHEVQERERRERLARADADRKADLAKVRARRADRPLGTRADLLARIFEIRAQHPSAAVLHRDFQSASEDDLRSLVDDLEDLISNGET